MKKNNFLPLRISIMVVSDSRTIETDASGKILCEYLSEAGHTLAEKCIVPDNIYQIRAVISRWIVDPTVDVVITTGGTGLTGRDGTPEAVIPLFDRLIEGFGEMFRWLSYEEISTSTIQSRVTAGVANGKYIFCSLVPRETLPEQLPQIVRNYSNLIAVGKVHFF